jgi:hypothetical protein
MRQAHDITTRICLGQHDSIGRARDYREIEQSGMTADLIDSNK